MTSLGSASADQSTARTPLTPNEVSQALAVNIYDREGKTTTLGELTKGKRSLLVFTRHFWCLNCQAYVRAIAESIPPSSLPSNTQILIIGNGSYQPIDTYATSTSSSYPIYTDPTCQLHAILKFNSALKEGSKEEEKRDYMQNAGSTMDRIWGGIKGAMGNLQHTMYIGPKALNGGEVVISADGECEYIYRMQNTVDHTNISDLAKIIGAHSSS
ncbi:hypothetical protein BKA66DRAFT_424280 [Pyrenochaeta sp. MPI-SDFR-AT-0127]|nr:hypothetical protein BKA66DRAFT_424280 [Pyrenochaeta sp. MPI-SDFR-AT-0127]